MGANEECALGLWNRMWEKGGDEWEGASREVPTEMGQADT